MSPEERKPLLQQLGRFYGEQHFAVTFTGTTTGADAKRVIAKGWDHTAPLADGNFGSALVAGRGEKRNIAIVLRPSNLIVVECDTEEDLVKITALELPQTLTVQSSEAYKRHFYFRPDPELAAIPYVAFRFENGKLTADAGRYFLAPPSIHPSGAVYSFLPGLGPEETPIAVLPAGLYEQLARQAGISQRANAALPGAPIAQGGRDQALTSLAGAMRRRGATEREILAALQVMNSERCRPPLDSQDLERIAGSISRYAPHVLPPTNGATPPEEEPGIPPERAIVVETWHQFESQAHEPMRLLIEGLWPEAAFGFLAAPPKKGKTWLGLAMNIALATGQDFLGLKIPQPQKVVYVALEGHRAALRARIGAIARGMGLDPDGNDLSNLHLIYKPAGLNLSDPGWTTELLDATQETEARMITVDVLRAAARIKENDQQEFVTLRNNLRPISDAGIALCLLHHFTKLSEISRDRAPGERMSGTGAMFGALDVGIYITGSDSDARRLRIEFDTRDLASPHPMTVELVGEGRGDNGGLTYLDRATFLHISEVQEADDLVAPVKDLHAWIMENGGDVFAKHLRAHFEISDDTLTRRLGRLAQLGVEYVGGRGKPGRLVIRQPDQESLQNLLTLDLPKDSASPQVTVREPQTGAETFPHNHAGLSQVTAKNPQDTCGNSETGKMQGKEVPAVPAPYGSARVRAHARDALPEEGRPLELEEPGIEEPEHRNPDDDIPF